MKKRIVDIINEEISKLYQFVMNEEIVRSTNSDSPQLDLSKKYINNGSTKPNGLWYEIDNDWVRFCAMGNVEWMRKYDITLDIDFSNILILDTYEKAIEFRKRYKVPMKQFAHISDPDFLEYTYHLNWGEVGKQYKGIEIPNIENVKQGDIMADDWLYSWDVDSGCIWDLSAIKNYKVVDCEMYKKRDKLMVDRD